MNTPTLGARFRHWTGWLGCVIDRSGWSDDWWLLEAVDGSRRIVLPRELHNRELWTALPTRAEVIRLMLPWWCEQLVRELLWGAWEQVLKRQGEALDRAFLRFCRLVNAAPCWPCRIDYAHPGRECVDSTGAHFAGLCITSGKAAEEAAMWDDWEFAK